MEGNKKEKDVQGAKNKDDRIKVSSGWELIRFCLKSKSFDSLLILMLGIFLFTMITAKQTVSSGKEEMEGVFVVFNWILAAISFFMIIFMGMIAITRKIRKSATSVILFAIIAVAVPAFIMMCYFQYLVTNG